MRCSGVFVGTVVDSPGQTIKITVGRVDGICLRRVRDECLFMALFGRGRSKLTMSVPRGKADLALTSADFRNWPEADILLTTPLLRSIAHLCLRNLREPGMSWRT
jgi:hypothetical protein